MLYTLEEFLKSKYFSTLYPYKINFIGLRQCKSDELLCTDFYFKSHNTFFVIKTDNSYDGSVHKITIESYESCKFMNLQNNAIDIKNNKVLPISYYVPKNKKNLIRTNDIVSYSEIKTYLTSNIVNFYEVKPKLSIKNFKLHETEFLEVNELEFINFITDNNEEIEFLTEKTIRNNEHFDKKNTGIAIT